MLDESRLQVWAKTFDRDPHFAEAWAELAIANMIGPSFLKDLAVAREQIDRALALERCLLRARAARGLWLLEQTPADLAGAEAQLNDVLAQDPNMSGALLWLSSTLGVQGRRDDAFAILERAARIDPLHPSIAQDPASEYRVRGHAQKAEQILNALLAAPELSFVSFISAGEFARTAGRLVYLHRVAQRASLRGIAPNHWSLALSHALLGDWPKSDYWLERSMTEFSTSLRRLYVAIVPQWQGDHEEGLRRFEATLADDPSLLEGAGWVPLWYGRLLARAGQYDSAIEKLEPLIVAENPAGSPTVPGAPEFFMPHALAWAYLQSGERVKAADLLAKLQQSCFEQVANATASSSLLHGCAETAVLRGDLETALQRFEQAIDAGWREYYLRVNDPYWALLRDDPRHQALMAEVKADVDRQAVEIARRDAGEDFVAKLDAAMAARASAKTG